MLRGQLQTNSSTYRGDTFTTVTYFLFEWEATQSIATNKSTITWTLKTVQTPTGSGYYRTVRGRYVRIDGNETSLSALVNVHDGTQILNGSIELQHNSSGEKTFSVEAGVQIGGYVYNLTASGSFELDTIPRKSIIDNVLQVANSLPNTTDGITNKVPLNIICYNDSFTHTITLSVNGTNYGPYQLLGPSNGRYISIPNATLTAMFNQYTSTQKSKSFTTTLTTLNNGQTIGTDSEGILYTMVEASMTKPAIVGTLTFEETDTSIIPLTSSTKFIKGFSQPRATLTRTSTDLKFNATLKSIILDNTYTMTTSGSTSTAIITNLASGSHYAQAIDSRDFTSNNISASMNLIDTYAIPYINNFNVERENGVGTTATATFNVNIWQGNFGNGNNIVTYLGYQIKESTSSTWGNIVNVTSQYDSSKTTQEINLGNTYTLGTAYDVRFVVKDGIANHEFKTSAYATGQIPDGKVLDGYNKTATGYQYGINQIPDTSLEDGLQVNGNLYLNGVRIWQYIGSQTLYDYHEITTDSTNPTISEAVLGGYNYDLIDGIFTGITIPNGYTKAYRITAEVTTSGGNLARVKLNNIYSNQVNTYSRDTYRKIISTYLFRESDIILETTLGYSRNGCNLYCINSEGGSASPIKTGVVKFYNIAVHGYIVKE